MANTRFQFEEITDFLSIYFMANCHHLKSYEGIDLMPYQSELWNFISYQSNKVVPFICVDKQNKLAGRDIARLAMDKMLVSAKLKDMDSLKRHMTEGINSFLKFALGNDLFRLIEDGYATTLKLVKNAPLEFTPEENLLLATAGNSIRNSGINAGLIKH